MKKVLSLLLFFVSVFTGSAQEIGVQLYSFRNDIPKDVAGMHKTIREMGITELEGGSTYGMDIEAYKKMITDLGFTMISISAEFEELEKDIPAVISRAKELGARYVTCFWIPHKEGGFTLEEAQRGINAFNNAGRILRETGIELCYHMHGYEFRPYQKGTIFDYMVSQTNPAYANFEMDVFWVKHPGQDPVALLKKYPGRFKLMHLKDRQHGTAGNQDGRADVESNVVLGTGDVGIAAIMKQARKSGVRHFFIEDESSRSIQQIPQSLAFLRSLKN